jgi:hypothetical protein
MIVKPSRVTDGISHNVQRTGIKGGKATKSAYGEERVKRPKAPKRKKGTKLHGP